MTRRTIALAFGAAIAAYLLVALSPIKSEIGRTSPAQASLFSPILFNFEHKYLEGEVLEFKIGMAKAQFFEALVESYSGRGNFTTNCISKPGSTHKIGPDVKWNEASEESRPFCANLDDGRTLIRVEFQNDVVTAVDLLYIRNEGP